MLTVKLGGGGSVDLPFVLIFIGMVRLEAKDKPIVVDKLVRIEHNAITFAVIFVSLVIVSMLYSCVSCCVGCAMYIFTNFSSTLHIRVD